MIQLYSYFHMQCGISDHARCVGTLLSSTHQVRYRSAIARRGHSAVKHQGVTLWFLQPQHTHPFRKTRRNVGVWMWELEDAPPRDFQAACSRVDELWASTRFLERAFAAAGRPVYYIPPFLPARPLRERPITDLFTVLTVSDAASNLRRKNPLGSLQAFQAAFRPDDRVELVVKTRRTNIDPEFWQRFRKLCEGWPVRIIESDLPRAEYQALLYSADCLLSMHRSEGFGIPIAEAMRAGIPTVATGYGGNMDWQTLENSVVVPFSMVELEHADGPYAAGAHWAEPDTEAAAEGLRRLYRDREWREALGAEAARTTETLLDPRRTLAAMQERISALETAC